MGPAAGHPLRPKVKFRAEGSSRFFSKTGRGVGAEERLTVPGAVVCRLAGCLIFAANDGVLLMPHKHDVCGVINQIIRAQFLTQLSLAHKFAATLEPLMW